jgi:hypothetical protein
MSRAKRLAEALVQDRKQHQDKPRATSRQRIADDFDPFAFTRWRVIADVTEPMRPGGIVGPGYLVKTPMRRGSVGWFIHCHNCGDEFESKGWKYCHKCMELSAEVRRKDAWKRAQDCAPSERLCEAIGCNNSIPRRARADTRYCSNTCARRARNARAYASRVQDVSPDFSSSTHEFQQQNQGAKSGFLAIGDFPQNLIGGDRRGRSLPRDLAKSILETEAP